VASIPDADQALVPKEKLYDYALSPDHPTGRHKAIRDSDTDPPRLTTLYVDVP
jgi:hypothetical protein